MLDVIEKNFRFPADPCSHIAVLQSKRSALEIGGILMLVFILLVFFYRDIQEEKLNAYLDYILFSWRRGG